MDHVDGRRASLKQEVLEVLWRQLPQHRRLARLHAPDSFAGMAVFAARQMAEIRDPRDRDELVEVLLAAGDDAAEKRATAITVANTLLGSAAR